MRVVNIVGFRRGYNFLNELLGLAKPFGKVVKHLVLDLRAEVHSTTDQLGPVTADNQSRLIRYLFTLNMFMSPHQAYLQFETEEEARAMAKFYSSNITASVCGRPVRISHSTSYPTIQVNSVPKLNRKNFCLHYVKLFILYM